MDLSELYLLSTYLKKWSFGENRISLNYSVTLNESYQRDSIDMRLASPVNMVNELLNHIFHGAKEMKADTDPDNTEGGNGQPLNIMLVNEPEVKRKLSVFLSKILREFNQNKRSRGRFKMINTRSLDFYYNDFEFEPLTDDIKFYVYLNRGVNKLTGDLWSNAVDDFKQALLYKEGDILANKYLAQALRKLGRHEESLEYLKAYAEADNSAESLEALASSYVHLGDFKLAKEVYKKIEANFPDSLLALFGKAQLSYKEGKGYKQLLDKIYKIDPDWLQEKIKSEWDYKLPAYKDREEHMWNAAVASRYLGFEKPFDLTRKAFNEELPSYFNSEKGTIRFVKDELEAWVDMMNRYKMDTVDYHTYEDRLTAAEIAVTKIKKKRTAKKKDENNAEE